MKLSRCVSVTAVCVLPGRIPPLPAVGPSLGSVRSAALRTVLVSCAASALVIVAAVGAVLCLLHGKRK